MVAAVDTNCYGVYAVTTYKNYKKKVKLMATEPKYPNIIVPLSGEDGNAFAIMGAVTKALRRGGVPANEITEYSNESMSGDYNNLIQTAMKWVTVE